MEAVVRTQGLSKDYGPVLALDALSVEIGSGVTGLVGARLRSFALRGDE